MCLNSIFSCTTQGISSGLQCSLSSPSCEGSAQNTTVCGHCLTCLLSLCCCYWCTASLAFTTPVDAFANRAALLSGALQRRFSDLDLDFSETQVYCYILDILSGRLNFLSSSNRHSCDWFCL